MPSIYGNDSIEKKEAIFLHFLTILHTSLIFLIVSSSHAATEIFIVKHRLATDILPIVQSVLSPQGKAVADNIGNTIVVNDTPEVIQSVSTLLLSSDRSVPQVRVQMQFGGDREFSGRHLSSQRRSDQAFVTVSSGSSGYIRMAQQVTLTDHWLRLCRHYSVPIYLKETKTIETGMEVMPIAAGKQIIVSITPRISWIENDTVQSYRFVDAATKVTVPRSRWIDIGGINGLSSGNFDILGKVLSTGTMDRSSFLISIRADIE